MVKFAKYSKSGVPLLEEDSYPTWKSRMRTHLQGGEAGLWSIVEFGYDVPEKTPDDEGEYKKFQ